MDERTKRIGDNESLFRQVNERLIELNQTLAVDLDRLEFLCECGRADCTDKIALDRSDYERVRADSTTFAVLVGHEFPDVETIIETNGSWAVVRKHEGDPADRVTAQDPRS